jgi:tetratricopeptide (TPR) repeat protein
MEFGPWSLIMDVSYEGNDIPIVRERNPMKHVLSTFSTFFIFLFVFSSNPAYAQTRSLSKNAGESLGKVDFHISCSRDAQIRFNKALALLHNMMYLQAEREFRAVADLDPDCAMAYWGIVMTLFHPLWAPPSDDELQRGWESVRKAAVLRPSTEREKGYIDAAAAFYRNWETVSHPERISAWEKAQEKVFKNYPDDIDAGALYALSHLATAPKGDKTFMHQERAGRLIEQLRKKAPEHPGLFHYTIHAYDNPRFASRALEVAKTYDKIAPDAPHAQHMPSHIFVRMGMWTLVSEWNTRSAAAAKKQSRPGELSLHYIHAMDYLMYAYLQRADDKMALETLNEINAVKNYQDSFASAYGIAAAQARFYLEQRKWANAAQLTQRVHSRFPWHKYPQFEAITYFARGLGMARSGDVSSALNENKMLDKLYEQTVNAGQDYWAVLVDSQRKTIKAWAEFAEKKIVKALSLMKKAAVIEDSVDKHPVTPGAVLPARELLGDMLVLLGKYDEAIDAYEASLRISPNRFNSLYGAGYAAENAGDFRKANYYYAKLIDLTSGVDSDRLRLKKAKTFLSNK